jgi:hypothetical protein
MPSKASMNASAGAGFFDDRISARWAARSVHSPQR